LSADTYIKETEDVYEHALREYEAAAEKGDQVLLRDACEKGWLAMVKATDALFIKKRLEPARSHEERRERLRELARKELEVERKGFYDRLGARGFHLHIQGFYDGMVKPEFVREELQKVGEYIRDIVAT